MAIVPITSTFAYYQPSLPTYYMASYPTIQLLTQGHPSTPTPIDPYGWSGECSEYRVFGAANNPGNFWIFPNI